MTFLWPFLQLWTTKRSQFGNFVTFSANMNNKKVTIQQLWMTLWMTKRVTILWTTSRSYLDLIFFSLQGTFAWFGRNIGKVVAPFVSVTCWIFIWKVESEEVGCGLLELLLFTIWTTLDLDGIMTFLWMILNLDLIVTFLWIICPNWYLNQEPLDLQSDTLPLCH